MRHWGRRVLTLVNAVSTALTLLTGLRENVLLSFFTGRFSFIRSRLAYGSINYGIAQLHHLRISSLPDLQMVGSEYDFHHAPTRSPSNLREDRNVCQRVNSMSASSLATHYDDHFGRGPRREQVFLYSISTPQCKVLNLDPRWLQEECTDSISAGNITGCHAFISTNFNTLADSMAIQVGIPVDFGVAGKPFLKCAGRPREPFKFGTDLLVLQSFWAGQSYHVEIQSSECWARATPIYGLFHVEPADQRATVVVAVPPVHWLLSVVPPLYASVMLFMIVRGLIAFLFKSRVVSYVPSVTEGDGKRWNRGFAIVSVDLAVLLQPIRERINVVQFFTTKTLVGSNLWMNHWLYITVSIIDSAIRLRTVYTIQEMGTWMLSKQVSLENFFFICSALTRLTWLTCLLHTLVRAGLTMTLSITKRLLLPWTTRHSRIVDFLVWYLNAVALLINFKIYSVLLVLQLYALLHTTGSTTLMRHADPAKQPVYGGFADLGGMWRSEIACDLLVMCSIQIAAAHVLGSLLLLTPFRHATHSRALQILQRRYVFVGWDAYVAMEALGIDPFRTLEAKAEGDGKGHVTPSTAVCTIAALTRQLYASGPSGWVRYAGDAAFLTQRSTAPHVGRLLYPLALAESMGFVVPADGSSELLETEVQLTRLPTRHIATMVQALSRRALLVTQASRRSVVPMQTQPSPEPTMQQQASRRRMVHLHVDSRWGDVVLADSRTPGRVLARLQGSTDGGVFAVHDALHLLDPEELQALVAGQLKLCIQ